MSLQTGTEVISLALLLNRVTGIYGILTLFTGYALSALQVSVFVLSLFIVIALGYLLPHIRRQSPLQNLALAYLYVIDTILNFGYVAAFATTWFLSQYKPEGPAGSDPDADATGSSPRREEDDEGPAATPQQATAGLGLDNGLSIALVVAFTLVRLYFILVVMAFARMVLHRYVDENLNISDETTIKEMSPDIFAVGAPLSSGWKGWLGRTMVSVGRGYWLGGRKEDEEWARNFTARFRA
ncbi:Inositolphosphorylceramide synthase subunit Kei1-domain-containing protein [Podospora didyma]|uniref:Inositolphosphorylceramide synthase subunit Kei1-domain-containing protein n=1 Tax=Podospora didyma TaxID=330526 RepID=A0AAE0P0P5_9PEZI|nr:Inositolphosphorylceramide synthase subunit Kei1-domain-containing protein [Podospora didyma]